MEHLDLDDPAAFQKAARDLGISVVVLAWQEEYGQIPGREPVIFSQLQELTLLAYHRSSGRILSCRLSGGEAKRKSLTDELTAAGFTVGERCRNVVTYGKGGRS